MEPQRRKSKMKTPVVVLAMLVLIIAEGRAQQIFKTEPPEQAIRRGRTIYVDDGTCPKGQIKMIVGGNKEKQIRRQRSCVPRL
jgi:hypothetical protein